jgi:DNA uptake protein ComE-like DNA-binding protein
MRSVHYHVFIALVALGLAGGAPASGQQKTPPPKADAKPPAKPDINSAWQTELQKLPGINKTLAKKIISNRPYDTVDDLKRAGVPASTIAQLKPLVRCEVGPHAPGQSIMPTKQGERNPAKASHTPSAAH